MLSRALNAAHLLCASVLLPSSSLFSSCIPALCCPSSFHPPPRAVIHRPAPFASKAVNPRAIKNQAKIASSTKKPRYPVYEQGGRIVWIKPGMEELIFGSSSAAAAEAEQQAPAELKITVQE